MTVTLCSPTVANATLPAGEVAEHWDELSREQQDAYFDALLEQVNSYLTRSGRKTIDLGEPVLAHPDLDLYVTDPLLETLYFANKESKSGGRISRGTRSVVS